jgi:hypothetical protein
MACGILAWACHEYVTAGWAKQEELYATLFPENISTLTLYRNKII